MRKEFIELKIAATRQLAQSCAPWAVKVIRVEEGWMAFESLDEYTAWKEKNKRIRKNLRKQKYPQEGREDKE